MAQFFAMTARGLQDVLEEELHELGFTNLRRSAGGVLFESNWAGCYRANLQLRTASRILLPVLDFPAYKPEELYNNIRKHDFTKYISANGTLAVESSVRESAFKDQRFVALKVKDAIVDQFWDKYGRRPDVDKADPDLRIVVRAVKSHFSVSLDTSGAGLFRRGYRREAVEAPLKENLAAGLIKMTGWNKDIPIVDPMCGSGTILIEAALMALNVAPGTLRKSFAFQRWNGFQEESWGREVEEALADEKTELPFRFYGFDIDRKAVKIARENAKGAGVEEFLQIERRPMEILEPPCESGMLIVNPPYGERLGTRDELVDMYKDLAHVLKTKFKGWTCWVLSGDPELSAAMKLKAERRIRVYNGPIECRFLKYNIF